MRDPGKTSEEYRRQNMRSSSRRTRELILALLMVEPVGVKGVPSYVHLICMYGDSPDTLSLGALEERMPHL